MKNNKVKVYCCGTDFLYELGHAGGGNTVYASKDEVKKYNRCHRSCGIVELDVTFSQWKLKQNRNISYTSNLEKNFESRKRTDKEIQLNHLDELKELYSEKLKNINKRIKEVKNEKH